MKSKSIFFLILLITCLNSIHVFAQDDDEGPEPPPPAPINDFITPAGMLCIAYGWYVVNNKRKLTTFK